MKPVLPTLKDFPRLKIVVQRLRRCLGPSAGVSSDYVTLKNEEADAEADRLRDAWKADALPERQRKLVDAQLAAYRRGEPVAVFDVMIQALKGLPTNVHGMSVLEVGCSSGYYSEVLELAGLDIEYVGCDYSEAFIDLARKKYPHRHFDVQDATALEYGEGDFDIVISGGCLLHIPKYETAIAETARVARSYAIFHRTPVVLGRPSVYYRKKAYGIETLEIHFNEPQFLELLSRSGLKLLATYTLDEFLHGGVVTANRTYVCEKMIP
jgi:SAM-dependent methyltransferase